ncbi:uncharacterized protein METZ01_LOCUS452898, partial [marine metagenome]
MNATGQEPVGGGDVSLLAGPRNAKGYPTTPSTAPGMTTSMSSGQGNSFSKIECALVNSPACDYACNASCDSIIDLQQGLDVTDVCNTSRSNNRHINGVSEISRGTHVDTTHHAIFADISVNDGFNTISLKQHGQAFD